jgi:hemolysin type calcium-binding protein
VTAIANGQIHSNGNYVDSSGNARYTGSFDNAPSKIVISGDDTASSVSTVSNNFLQHITSFPVDGTRIDTIFNPDGTKVEKSFDQSNHFDWDRKIVDTGSGGQPLYSVEVADSGAISSFLWKGQDFTAADIAGIFGSNLGKLLGGNSLVGTIAAGTLIGAIGREIGDALKYGTSFTIDGAVDHALGSLVGAPGIGTLPSAGIGALSSLLIGELADALHLHGFEHGLFQAVGTTITTQLVTNAYGVMTGAVHADTGLDWALTDGFNPEALAGNIAGVVGAYFGNYLAGQVVHAQYQSGAIGAQIGSSIGAFVGMSILGPIGAFIGSFVGDLAGSVIGDLLGLGADPHSTGRIWYDGAAHHFVTDGFTEEDGGSAEAFRQITQYQAGVLNSLLDFSGAQVDPSLLVPTRSGALMGPGLSFYQDGHTFTMHEAAGDVSVYVNNSSDFTPLVDPGAMALVHAIHLSGGDPLVRLAWDHSSATNTTAFQADLQAAKDYREYLDDKDTIDALMAVEPGSAFTAGWALTLLKARELGLDAVPANDDFRNGNDVAYGTAGADHMVGGAGNDNFSGLGGNDRLSGGPGDDVLFGYAGNDAIDGGAGFDRALFAGSRVLYTISKLGNGLVRVSGQDGTDTLSNVEQLIFADATVTDDYADRLGADDDAPMLPAWMTQRHDPRAPKTLWN